MVLVEDVDVPSFFAKGGSPPDADPVESGLALLFLLLLLTVLAALAQDTDLGALIDELIEQLLALLRGG